VQFHNVHTYTNPSVDAQSCISVNPMIDSYIGLGSFRRWYIISVIQTTLTWQEDFDREKMYRDAGTSQTRARLVCVTTH